MIELVIVLIKQLLMIPDQENSVASAIYGGRSNLQKRLILAYKENNVLDLLVYLSQEFTESLNKKLAIHILEIQYHIFKNFTPAQIVNPKLIQ